MFRASCHRGSTRRYRAATFSGTSVAAETNMDTGRTRRPRFGSDSNAVEQVDFLNPIPFRRRQSMPIMKTREEPERVAEVWVSNVEMLGIRVLPHSRFMFVMRVTWSRGHNSEIVREYEDIFKYHCWLLETFPDEAGFMKKSRRIIPYIPGKKLFRRNTLSLAEERQPLLGAYMKQLVTLPCVKKNAQAQAFFCWRPGDPKPNQSPVVFAVNEQNKRGRLQSVKVQTLGGLKEIGEENENRVPHNKGKDSSVGLANTSFKG